MLEMMIQQILGEKEFEETIVEPPIFPFQIFLNPISTLGKPPPTFIVSYKKITNQN